MERDIPRRRIQSQALVLRRLADRHVEIVQATDLVIQYVRQVEARMPRSDPGPATLRGESCGKREYARKIHSRRSQLDKDMTSPEESNGCR